MDAHLMQPHHVQSGLRASRAPVRVFDFGFLRVARWRETGRLVAVGEDTGQHPKHTGAVD